MIMEEESTQICELLQNTVRTSVINGRLATVVGLGVLLLIQTKDHISPILI